MVLTAPTFFAGFLLFTLCYAVFNVIRSVASLLWRPIFLSRFILVTASAYLGLDACVRLCPGQDEALLGYALGWVMVPLGVLWGQHVSAGLRRHTPSKWALLLYRIATPIQYQDELLGDLIEIHARVKEESGTRAANLFLWSTVIAVVLGQLMAGLRTFADMVGKLRGAK